MKNIAIYSKRKAVGSYEILLDSHNFYVNEQVDRYLKQKYYSCK
ncbi:hypothetical protein [Poseidonibacter ostreae]|nr:hypothetical protein [Poseidonibacter ostreae]